MAHRIRVPPVVKLSDMQTDGLLFMLCRLGRKAMVRKSLGRSPSVGCGFRPSTSWGTGSSPACHLNMCTRVIRGSPWPWIRPFVVLRGRSHTLCRSAKSQSTRFREVTCYSMQSELYCFPYTKLIVTDLKLRPFKGDDFQTRGPEGHPSIESSAR